MAKAQAALDKAKQDRLNARTDKARFLMTEVAMVNEATCDVAELTKQIAIAKEESVPEEIVKEAEDKLALS